MSKIAVFLAEGFEEIEALTVVDLCRRVKIETLMVSVSGNSEVKGSHGIGVRTDAALEEVDFDSLDMLVLPGGMPGTKGLEQNALLMEQVDRFYAAERYIGAICAAPSILGHKGYLRGRNACCFPDFESHLEGAQICRDSVAVSGHIITGRGMGCSIDFALAIIEALRDSETAKKLAKTIVYR